MIRAHVFFKAFVELLFSATRVLIALFFIFVLMAITLWWAERGYLCFWQSLYMAAITALTVGYGDFTPHTDVGRVLAVCLGLIGITFMGVVVAATVKAIEAGEEAEMDRRNEETRRLVERQVSEQMGKRAEKVQIVLSDEGMKVLLDKLDTIIGRLDELSSRLASWSSCKYNRADLDPIEQELKKINNKLP
jgi:voltage-gated potassium channel